MENVSKALLIAGGAMMAILLLTLFSYLSRQMSESTGSIAELLSESEITVFNQQFLKYEERGVVAGTEPLSVHDVASIMNLAKNCNESGKYPTTVTLKLNNSDIFSRYETSEILLQQNKLSTTQYKCTEIKIDSKTKLVCEVDLQTL